MKKITAGLMCSLLALVPFAYAHEGSRAGHGVQAGYDATAVEQHAFGRAGDPARVSRTVHVVMDDNMRFSPSELSVKQGEVIKFVVSNRGHAMHEMVIGTRQKLAEHAEMMRKFPDMEHEEAHMVHVAPGKSGSLVWHFNRAGEFDFACLIPGHFEAGMVGKITVNAAEAPAAP